MKFHLYLDISRRRKFQAAPPAVSMSVVGETEQTERRDSNKQRFAEAAGP